MEKALAEKMIDLAIEQLNFSYTPYSHFKVWRLQHRERRLRSYQLCRAHRIFQGRQRGRAAV